MAQAKRLILHIGATKTGSSALQAGLDAQRDRLAAQGVLYPSAGIASHAHHLLAAACHPGAWRMHQADLPEDRTMYAIETGRAIMAEAEARACDTILLSSEYLWGQFRPWHYAPLVAAFPKWRFEILAVLRRPDDWAVSSWLQAVKSGNAEEFDAYFDRHFDKPASSLRYDRVVMSWRTLTSARKTHLVEYESIRDDVLGYVADLLGVDLDGATAPQSNRSPSAEELAKLIEINRSDRPDDEKAAARRKVMAGGTLKRKTRWEIDETQRRRIWDIAGPSLKRLTDALRYPPFYADGPA